jgi:hypothetical protein
MIKWTLLFATMLLTIACSRRISPADLPGVFTAQMGAVSQQISVRADGTYSNVLYRDGKIEWSDENRWASELHSGTAGITFTEFRFGVPGYNARKGYWFVEPEWSFFGVKKLCFDPDLDRCFEGK